MKELRQNLTSAYLQAARSLSPKKARRRILAYVESYDDIAFWRTLLAEFENEERYFQVMLPSSKSLARGKKMVLLNLLRVDQLGENLVACVDSDYDFLLQGATPQSRKVNENPYILQTYSYAIENYHCYADSLHEVCVQATLNDRSLVDFPAFLQAYSQVVYPLFLWNIYFYRRHDQRTFPMYDFHTCTRLTEVDLKRLDAALNDVHRRVEAKLGWLRRRFPKWQLRVDALGRELEPLGLRPDTTYLYIQGHHLMENVVMKLLTPVCTALRREREREIKQLAEHREQMQNELTCYENSLVSIGLMLKKNDGYKNLYLYQWMRRDVERLLQQFK